MKFNRKLRKSTKLYQIGDGESPKTATFVDVTNHSTGHIPEVGYLGPLAKLLKPITAEQLASCESIGTIKIRSISGPTATNPTKDILRAKRKYT